MATAILNGQFEETTHEYRDSGNRVVPSVTQILEGCGFSDYSNVPRDILEHKRQIGDSVHFATAALDRKKYLGANIDEGELWGSLHDECVQYVLAWDRFCEETKFTPELVEQGGVFAVNGMPYGYTIDAVGRFAGMPNRFVIEKKTALEETVAWRMQTAAYARTVMQSDEFIGRCAVKLLNDGTYKLPKSGFYQEARDWDKFYLALCLTHVKINEGVTWRKDKV